MATSYLTGDFLAFNSTGIGGAGTLAVKVSGIAGAIQLYNTDDSSTAFIQNVTDPILPQDAATKNYVDSIAGSGVTWKQAVQAASSADDIDLATGGLLTIDGVALTSGDRVLVKNQTDPTENGIYVATTGTWSRSYDATTADQASGAAMFVIAGTGNGGQAWVCPTTGGSPLFNPVDFGAAITFVQMSALSQVAGANTQVQFNNNGVFGASADFTFNDSTDRLTTVNVIATAGITSAGLNVTGSSVLVGLTAANTLLTNLTTAGLNATGQTVLVGVTASALKVSGQTTLSDATLTGQLAVLGISSLDGGVSTASLSVSGATALQSVTATYLVATGISTTHLNISGVISAANLVTTNITTGGLNATGQTVLAGVTASALKVSGQTTLSDATLTGQLAVLGLSSLDGGVTTASLSVAGATALQSATATYLVATGISTTHLNISGVVSAANLVTTNITTGGLNATGQTVLAGVTASALKVSGQTTLTDVTASGALAVFGLSMLDGGVTTSTLDVSGQTTLVDATITGQLAVLGLSSLDGGITTSSLSVSGETALQSVTATYLVATGISAGSLNISGTISLDNIVSINISTSTLNASTGISTARLLVTNGVTANALVVSGLSQLNGGITTSSLDVSGATNLQNVTEAVVTASSMTVTGALYVGSFVNSPQFNATSDEKFKRNIEPLENALEVIRSVKGYSYDWKEDFYGYSEGRQFGVIAQQLEEVGLTNLVNTQESKSVNYIGLIPLLIESVKELAEKFDGKKVPEKVESKPLKIKLRR